MGHRLFGWIRKAKTKIEKLGTFKNLVGVYYIKKGFPIGT